MRPAIRISAVLCSMLVISQWASGQYTENASSDRPGQALTPLTVGKNVLQVQSGVKYESYDTGIEGKANMLGVVSYLRLGLIEQLEVNALITWQRDKLDVGQTTSKGISNTQIGARYNFFRNEGFISAMGLQAGLLLKAQSEVYRRDQIGSIISLNTAANLTPWLGATVNLIAVWPGYEDSFSLEYVWNFGASFAENWSAFVEVYGAINGFSLSFDTGIAYLLSNDFQLDFSFGLPDSGGRHNWFIDGGFTWRIDWHK